MWEKIAGLIEEIDAQLIVLNADVHVHAADYEAPPNAGKVLGNRLIARPLRELLRAPARKGMGRGGDRRQAVLGGEISHRATQACELRARLARSLMHAGAHLDLGFEELARDLALESLLGGLEQGLRHLAHEIARRPVDEEVFLFDANAKGRILEAHGEMLARFGLPSNRRTLAGPAILGMAAGAARAHALSITAARRPRAKPPPGATASCARPSGRTPNARFSSPSPRPGARARCCVRCWP